jgi:GT2 family glycosyltransferase
MNMLAIVPVMNLWESYTLPMLRSLASPRPLALLVIDNGSDGSADRVCEVADRFAAVSVIRNRSNRGVAASWNQGVRWGAANGYDHFLIMNNDLVVHPRAIENLTRVFERDDVYLASMYDVGDDLGAPEDLPHFRLTPPTAAPAPNFSAFLIGTKTLAAMTASGDPLGGLFDEGFFPAYFEDNDYYYRLKLYLGESSAIASTDALCYHYCGRTQYQLADAPIVPPDRYEENCVYYVKKWGGKPGQERFRSPFG